MYDTPTFFMFLAIIGISHLLLFVAVIFALVGYFSKEQSDKDRNFIIAGKLLIACALFVAVGSGGCILFAALT